MGIESGAGIGEGSWRTGAMTAPRAGTRLERAGNAERTPPTGGTVRGRCVRGTDHSPRRERAQRQTGARE